MNSMTELQLWLLVALASVPSYGIELRLETTKPELIAGEPADLRLVLGNDGVDPVYVTEPLFRYGNIQVSSGLEWYDCHVEQFGTPCVIASEWLPVDPQGQLPLGLPIFACTPDGTVADTLFTDWRAVPGQYRLRVRWSHRPSAGSFARGHEPPDNALDGSFQSNEVVVTVLNPTGVNAEAFAWAKENHLDPVSIEVVNHFPTSRYATIVNYRNLLITNSDPSEIVRLMDKKLYPLPLSVPDPKSRDGWRTPPGSEEMARWQLECGEKLLRDDPDFPYLREVRLSMAVSYAALGLRTQSTRILKEIAEETGTEEGEWASKFLALKGWSSPPPS